MPTEIPAPNDAYGLILQAIDTGIYKPGDQPTKLSQANRRFHRQIHLASHNRFLVQQLDLVLSQ